MLSSTTCYRRLRLGVAEIDGDEANSRRLRAEVKQRLINISEELWELARITTPPEQTVESGYKKLKQTIEEHRSTASEWMKDLPSNTIFNKERNDANQDSCH